MDNEKRTAANAIMAFIDWYECVVQGTDYERGIKLGLMIAQQIAEEVEWNG